MWGFSFTGYLILREKQIVNQTISPYDYLCQALRYNKTMNSIIEKLPAYLDNKEGRCYLTLGAWKNGWQATYLDSQGFGMKGFSSIGRSPEEALLNLKENIDVLKLLEAPAIYEGT